MLPQTMLVRAVALIVVVLVASPAQTPAAPDLVPHSGIIVTVDSRFAVAQAIAISGGVIGAVGSNETVRRPTGPSTKSIDLRGRTVLPGLMDNHSTAPEAVPLLPVPNSEFAMPTC